MVTINPDRHRSREVDPRYLHMEQFRQTFGEIRHRQQLASRALHDKKSLDLGSHKGRHVFSKFAHDYSAQLERDDSRKIYASLLGTMPAYVDAVQVLPAKHHGSFYRPHLTPEEHEMAVEKTIAYNDSLRGIIDQHPRLQPDIILGLVTAAAAEYRYSEHERTDILYDTRARLRGMQHELAFESVLYYLPQGFEIIDTDDSDDAKGADFKVRCPNGVIVSIDVKASLESEEEARERRLEHFAQIHRNPPANKLILYSGFRKEDFGEVSPWRPSHNAIMRVLPHVEAALLKASQDTARTLANA